jgi:hypothetical protein
MSLNKLRTNKSLSRHVRPEADRVMHSYDVYRQHPLKHNRFPRIHPLLACKQNEDRDGYG